MGMLLFWRVLEVLLRTWSNPPKSRVAEDNHLHNDSKNLAYLHEGGKSLFRHPLNLYQVFHLQNSNHIVCACIYIIEATVNKVCFPTFAKWPWISLQPRMSFAFLSPICCRLFSSLRQPVFRICRIFCLDWSTIDWSSWDSQALFVLFSLPPGDW